MAIVQHSFLDGKICTKCKEWKPSAAFNPRSDNGKPRPWCVECNRLSKIKHRHENREHVNQTRRAYYASNQNTIRGKQQAAYNASPKKRQEALRRVVEWQKSHPEQHRAARKVLEANRRISNGKSNYVYQDWLAMCAWFDNICLCCGCAAPLEIDHIVPISRGGQNTIENVQPLCMACNRRKGARHDTDYRDPARLAEFLRSIGH